MYKLSSDFCVIHTVDFFPPIVDDPYEFGQVAAANSLSDVYAMGGKPISALNLLAVPSCLDTGVIREILAGGNEKAIEAGINISGGHSIEDQEPKYGLSVVGIVAEKDILPNGGGKAGEVLVLTKALGTGAMTTADKVDLLTASQHRLMIDTLASLNKRPAELARDLQPSACTDVTGFGLIGHAAEMAEGAGLTMHLFAKDLPLLDGALELAKDGILPAAVYRNRAHLEGRYAKEKDVPLALEDIAFDPQTSGGLLFALPMDKARTLISRLESENRQAWIVGELVDKEDVSIRLLDR